MLVQMLSRLFMGKAGWLMLLGLLLPCLSLAHPLGNFSVNHYTRLHIDPDGIALQYLLDLAEIPTFQVFQEAGITPQEGQMRMSEFLAHQMETLKAGLRLEVNGQPLLLQGVSQQMLLPPGAGGLPTLKMSLGYRAALPVLAAEAASIFYQDNNFPGRTGWHEVIALAGDGVTLLESSVPATDRSQGLTDYPTDLLNSPPQIRQATLRFRVPLPVPASPAALPPPALLPASAETTPGALNTARQSTPRNAFTELMTTPHLSASVIALALLIAAGLGAFHALEPGHGKTVVAAYLVGTRGTAWHALYLGLIVTLTHTIGVYVLGGITLYASHSIVPEQLYPWLGVCSGLLIAGLGVYLFCQRYYQPLAGHAHGHAHHGHHTHHPHDHDHDHAVAYAHAAHHHHHGEESVPHPHPHAHGHAHPHPHLPADATVSFRTLLTLGVTGGIVPCPAALVVLLSAVSLQRIGFGLLLIVAFSLGLAAVLIVIGLLMVYARHFMARFQGEGWLMSRWLPLTSAAVITLIGLAIAGQGLVQAVTLRLL